MTKSRNSFNVEWEFFSEDERFLSVSWQARYIYLGIWGFAFSLRKEVSKWQSRDRLLAQLQIVTGAPLKVIDQGLQELAASGLITFDGSTLTVPGLAEKNQHVRYWYSTKTHLGGFSKLDRSKTTPIKVENPTHMGTENNPNGCEKRPVVGPLHYHRHRQVQSTSTLPSLSHVDEPQRADDRQASAVVCANEKCPEGSQEMNIPKPEVSSFDPHETIRGIRETFSDSNAGRKFRGVILRTRYGVSDIMLPKLLAVGEERLLRACAYVETHETTNRAGALVEYATKHPIPASSEDKIHEFLSIALKQGRKRA